MVDDLREFIDKAQELGECQIIEGADWDLEIGAITELSSYSGMPLLLFDKIKGYPAGYRVATNLFASPARVSLSLGLPQGLKGVEFVKAWREKTKGGFKAIPPVEVETGPVKENILTDRDVNLFKFPAPRWHELDGGRYIGTGDMVIVRDPDEKWINIGTYRIQVHDEITATIFNQPGAQGKIIREKYWAKGLSCPAAVSLGQDPLLFTASGLRIPWGISEYDYAGWWKGKPVEVTKGVFTDLPIPAWSEIVLEGEILPPEVETRVEGPFGEWTGYYASEAGPQPVFKVRAILHRNNPIIQGSLMFRRQPLYSESRNIIRAASLWNALEVIPGIKGVWLIEDAQSAMMPVVSIEQKYTGHAKQVAMAVMSSSWVASMSRIVIIIDDDLDPSNISDVIWAISTRCDPATQIDIIRNWWSSQLDPILSPEKRARKEFSKSVAVIEACKPYHWMKDFPRVIKTSDEFLAKTRNKWQDILKFPD